MNNYMQQIADMLGVELGEVFYVSWEGNSNGKQKFALSDDGLYQIAYVGLEEEFGAMNNRILMRILTGKAKVIKRPWKPNLGETYYKVYTRADGSLNVGWERWLNLCCDLAYWKVGNCFRTQEEAELKGKQIIEQIESEFRKA